MANRERNARYTQTQTVGLSLFERRCLFQRLLECREAVSIALRGIADVRLRGTADASGQCSFLDALHNCLVSAHDHLAAAQKFVDFVPGGAPGYISVPATDQMDHIAHAKETTH